MTLTETLKRLAMVVGIGVTVATVQRGRGPRTDAPRHIHELARDEGWTRRQRLAEARRHSLRGVTSSQGV
jgi:hypothetical protein